MTRLFASLAEGVHIAVNVILHNRIRSALTILGVGVAVSVIVAFGALLQGVEKSLNDIVESAGPENLWVVRRDITQVSLTDLTQPWNLYRGYPRMTARDAQLMARLELVDDAYFSIEFNTNVDVGGERIENVPGRGFAAGWPQFNSGTFVAGRDFTGAEVREASRVVILFTGVAEELFGQQDPIGRSVRLSSKLRDVREEFRVIGLYEPDANVFDDEPRNWVVIPHSAARSALREQGDDARIIAVPVADADPNVVRDDLVTLLRRDRGLGPRDDNNFGVLLSEDLNEAIDEVFGVLFLVVVGLSSAGLFVGGIGVVGIMLISVTERTREIGVRKALGATRREILWQFLVESGLLTTLGGVAGLLLGYSLALVVSMVTVVDASIPLWSVAVAILGALLTGVVFGIVPAWRAARLQPVEALRAE